MFLLAIMKRSPEAVSTLAPPLRRFGFGAFVSDWTDLLEATSAEIRLFGVSGQQLNLIQENLKLAG